MGKNRHHKDLIRRMRKDQGPPKPHIKPHNPSADDIRALKQEGWSQTAIARFYRCSRMTIWRKMNPEKHQAQRQREGPQRPKPKAVDDDFLSGPLSWFGM